LYVISTTLSYRTWAATLGLLVLVLSVVPLRANEEPQWRHALSLFGDVKYPADFKRFDYVNPDAPKGGVVRA
jgi:microcin C transport system substrate-binding protein